MLGKKRLGEGVVVLQVLLYGIVERHLLSKESFQLLDGSFILTMVIVSKKTISYYKKKVVPLILNRINFYGSWEMWFNNALRMTFIHYKEP